MQPNTYYEITEIKPPKPAKKPSKLPLILAIIFATTTVGLTVILILGKFAPKQTAPTGDTETHVLSAPLSTRLSEINIPDGSAGDIIKNALAGRTFVLGSRYDQFLRFTNDSKYEFAYYIDPQTDFRKLQASDDNGEYKITDNKTITLSGGESFDVVGDYLVKTTDALSHNKKYIYFDNVQYPNIIQNLTVAYASHINSSLATDDLRANKIFIDDLTCFIDNPNMTAADTYSCNITTTAHFDPKNIDPLLEINEENIKESFADLCATKTEKFAKYYLGPNHSTCNNDYSITTTAIIIVRTDNISYRITGLSTALTE